MLKSMDCLKRFPYKLPNYIFFQQIAFNIPPPYLIKHNYSYPYVLERLINKIIIEKIMKLVFLDLDGTLLTEAKVVEDTLRILDSLIASGNPSD